ncbi:MAG: insulinase family protein, partial [Pyrinomonadaceae bacterium]|nr:insulinase family protein [Pyrinomonadaceae bacterium]
MFSRAGALLLTVAFVASGGWTQSIFAQTDTAKKSNMSTTQTEDFRKQAPTPLASKPLNIPKPFETVLPNGLRVVILEEKRLPLVSYRLALRTGGAHNPSDMPGLISMMASLLNEGTETRTSKQIADEIARMGATLVAGSNADYTTVAASALSIYSDQVLDLMADVSLHPSFPQNEIDIAKQNAKQGLIQQRAQPSFLAGERLAKTLFGAHPYSVVSSTPESIDALTREKLQSYHRQTFIPNNAVIFVVGDVQRAATLKRITELFGGWGKGQPGAENFPAPPVRTTRAIYLVDRPGSQQSTITIANLAINRSSPDYFPMLLLNTMLGGSFSPRLDQNLRENKGYTYGASSSLDARRAAGAFRASAEVRTPVTGASLKEFFFELDRIRTEPIPEQELKDNKAFLTGLLPIRIETQEGLTDQFVQIKMFDLPENYLQAYRDRINAVTASDVQRVAQKYVTTDKVAIVIVGDAAEIMEQIKPYAQTIEIYDAMGKRKEMTASTDTGGPIVNAAGTWTLEITGPGGNTLPATLNIKQDGNKISGSVTSQLGESELKPTTIRGNAFDATLVISMGGQTSEAQVSGTVENDTMKGTISLQGIAPLPFTGKRN